MKGSRDDGDFIMGLLNLLLFNAFKPSGSGEMHPVHEDIIAELPLKVRMVLSQFDLEAKTTVYAVCPDCHYTHPPHFRLGETVPQYRSTCNNRRNPESEEECGARLLRGNSD